MHAKSNITNKCEHMKLLLWEFYTENTTKVLKGEGPVPGLQRISFYFVL